MQKIEIPEVSFINGIYLTKQSVDFIDVLQTGGTISHDDWTGRDFHSGSLMEDTAKIDEIIHYFIDVISDSHREIDAVIPMLGHLNWIIQFLQSFAVPDNIG